MLDLFKLAVKIERMTIHDIINDLTLILLTSRKW